MKYTETTASYNDRRYGKPWMAFVSATITKDFRFIDWDGRSGQAGEFCFDAEPGTILAYGQKDIRKGRGGVNGYQICMPDGTLPGFSSDADARNINKLPISERCLAYAKLRIETAETKLAATPDSSYADEWRVTIERFSKFFPQVDRHVTANEKAVA